MIQKWDTDTMSDCFRALTTKKSRDSSTRQNIISWRLHPNSCRINSVLGNVSIGMIWNESNAPLIPSVWACCTNASMHIYTFTFDHWKYNLIGKKTIMVMKSEVHNLHYPINNNKQANKYMFGKLPL